MPNNYPFKPRGIVKWHAFAALISGEEQKLQATEIKNIEIELLDDNLNLLDITLGEAMSNDYLLDIKYLEDNEIKYLKDKIKNVNNHNNEIELTNKKLKIKQIIDLSIIDK